MTSSTFFFNAVAGLAAPAESHISFSLGGSKAAIRHFQHQRTKYNAPKTGGKLTPDFKKQLKGSRETKSQNFPVYLSKPSAQEKEHYIP